MLVKDSQQTLKANIIYHRKGLTLCKIFVSVICCNDPMIVSYNDYHLSPNSILSGNQRWYGLVYLVYK